MGAKTAVVDFLLKELNEDELRAFAQAIKKNKRVIFASEISVGKINYPHPLLRITSETGFYNVITDEDGMVRRVRTKFQDEYYLGAKILVEGKKSESTATNTHREIFNMPDEIFVNLRPNIKKISEIDGSVKDSVVVIAPHPVDWRDILPIAYNTVFSIGKLTFSGAEFLASAYLTLLYGDRIKTIGFGEIPLVILLVVLVGIGNFFGWGIIKRTLYGISILLFTLLLFCFFFIKFNLALPFSEIVLASAFQGIFGTVVRYRFVESKRRVLERFFKRYVNEDVLRRIAENPDSVKLGGDIIRATVMVVDIKGFTGIAENLPPDELVTFINTEFDWMTEKIVECSGMVISYLGDAVFSIFGAPVEKEDFGATDALLCAIEIFKTANQRGLKIDIAISTGEVLVGNIGSRRKMEYTAMGDTVNTAFRMEAMCSSPDGEIVLSDDVIENIKGNSSLNNKINFEKIGEFALRGKRKTTKIFRAVLTHHSTHLTQNKS